MKETELPTPFRGVARSAAFTEQPPETVPDALNVRVRDMTVKRDRRCVRSGLTRLSSSTVNGADVPIKRSVQVVYDSRKVSYTGLTPDSTSDEVKFALPLKKPCPAGAIDAQSNVYVFDGNSTVVKYNATGERQWSYALPVADTAHVCRAIDVDGFGIVYAGTSSGGRDDKGRLWALIQKEDNSVEILWTVETEAYVEQCKVYKARLWALLNQPSTGQSWIVAYDGKESPRPVEGARKVATSGANALWFSPTGNIWVAAEATPLTSVPAQTLRAYDPRGALGGRIVEDWKLSDLTDIDTRIWAEYDPQTLLDAGIENGGDVEIWEDSGGHGRDLLKKSGAGAPTLIRNSLGRLPAVMFGGDTVSPAPVLVSGTNASTAAGFSDNQSTMLPAYEEGSKVNGYTDNAQTVLFMLVRPERNLIGGLGMGFFKQPMNSAVANSAHFLAFNIDSNGAGGSLTAGTATAGRVRYQAGTLAAGPVANGGGTGNAVSAGSWSVNAAGCVLITLVLNHGTTNVNTDHPSQFRLNGAVVDEFNLYNAGAALLAGTFSATEIGSIDFGVPATYAPFRGTVHYMAVLNRRTSNTNNAPIAYPFTQNSGTASFAPDTSGDSELERIEGWIAHRFGVAFILNAAHPFTDSKGTPNKLGITSHSLPWLLQQNFQVLSKYSPSGELKAVLTTYAAYRAFAAQSVSGIGFGGVCDSDGNAYTMGPHTLSATGAPSNDYTQLRKIIDNGDSLTFIAATAGANANSATPSSTSGAWSKTYNDYTEQTGVANLDILAGYHYPRVGVDKQDVVYFPWSATTGSFSGVALIAYDKTGGQGLTNQRAITGNNGLGLAFGQNGYAALADPNVPTFDATSLSGSGQNAKLRAEFVWMLTDLGTGGGVTNETVHKVRLITPGRTTGSPRTLVAVHVAGGAWKKGLATITSPATPGSGFASNADFIDLAVAFGQVFGTDGLTYQYYNPKTDVGAEYKATKGRIPPRCKFFTFWRGRMVAGRSADDGHVYHMSRQGDVFDWDVDAPTFNLPTQAVDGTSQGRIGRCPDIINGIIDVNDDVLLLPCDHSIWRLTGDPQEGGRFDQVTDVIGGTFGRGYVKDPAGNVYLFATRGDVLMIPPQGYPVLISGDISADLRTIDFSSYHVGMEWDYEDEGLRLFVLPFGQGGTVVTHWFWDAKNRGWWPDQYGKTGQRIQPTSTVVIDGDAQSDRMLVYGCEDGFLRKVDKTSKADDATAAGAAVPINSYMVQGPVWTHEGRQGRITEVTAEMSSVQGFATVDLFAADTADAMGLAKASFTAGAGRNPARHVRAKGSYAWLKIRATSPTNRWAIERLAFKAAPAGRSRVTT